MPNLERCAEPLTDALAFNNPLDTITEHRLIIGAQFKYWQSIRSRGERQVNLTAYTTSQGAVDRLTDALSSTALLLGETDEQSMAMQEANRRSAIGLTGFTLLFRRMIRSTDAIGTGTGDTLLDTAMDEEGMYAEDRVHVHPEGVSALLPPHEQADEWFFDGKLYVHRQVPATDHVRDSVTLLAMEHNVAINPEGLVTLSGFLPSNYTEHLPLAE